MLAALLLCAAQDPDWKIQQLKDAIVVTAGDREALRYHLVKPHGSSLSVESGCFFHPLTTPAGVPLTDLAPEDHLHHRGVFFGFVEMHGAADADFWGWGEKAPKERRAIRNVKIENRRIFGPSAHFTARNEWDADGTVLLEEETRVALFQPDGATRMLTLIITLTPKADIALPQWAFSGFCVRTRKDGDIEAHGPEGKVELADPSRLKPESDWPDAPWYAYALKLPDGARAGVAVMSHPTNPRTLWHNHRGVRMLNPSITAAGPLALKAGKPLTLGYRVVLFDGETPRESLTSLARDWNSKDLPR